MVPHLLTVYHDLLDPLSFEIWYDLLSLKYIIRGILKKFFLLGYKSLYEVESLATSRHFVKEAFLSLDIIEYFCK